MRIAGRLSLQGYCRGRLAHPARAWWTRECAAGYKLRNQPLKYGQGWHMACPFHEDGGIARTARKRP